MGVNNLTTKNKWSDEYKKLAGKRNPLLNETEG
jgi:hypothetical protein